MKNSFSKLFLIVAFVATVIIGCKNDVQAQPYSLVGGAYGLTEDTVDNTETIIKFIKVTGSYETITIQAIATKISGTMGGTCIPVASNDGINFIEIPQKSVAISAVNPAYKDTVTWGTGSAAQTFIWTVPSQEAHLDGVPKRAGYLYYGVKFTGTGTMSAKFSGNIMIRTGAEGEDRN